jgi:predicted amidohydrolase
MKSVIVLHTYNPAPVAFVCRTIVPDAGKLINIIGRRCANGRRFDKQSGRVSFTFDVYKQQGHKHK